MNRERLKELKGQLQRLDERLTYKVRPRRGGGVLRPGLEQLDERLDHLAEYAVELKGILEELLADLAADDG